MIKVFKCGIKVETRMGKIEGIITAVCIRADKISYEFSYFSGTDYKNIWLSADEFTTKGNTTVSIGYK